MELVERGAFFVSIMVFGILLIAALDPKSRLVKLAMFVWIFKKWPITNNLDKYGEIADRVNLSINELARKLNWKYLLVKEIEEVPEEKKVSRAYKKELRKAKKDAEEASRLLSLEIRLAKWFDFKYELDPERRRTLSKYGFRFPS